MTHQPALAARRRHRGFSLVEMAVVLIIASIALTMGLGLLRATRDNAAWSETKLKQEKIKVALIAFLRSNGRLPCPNSVAPWDGAEDTPCLVNSGRGVVPWTVLGLSIADAQDGWSRFFTYRVANDTPASSSNWTIQSGVSPFSITELSNPLPTFSLRERNAAGVLGAAITPNPVVMLVSHGKNGAGARTTGGTLLAMPVGADEITNATAGSTSFVTRAPNEVAASAGGVFDDVAAYMTPQQLLQALIDEKTLKACYGYCTAAGVPGPGPGCVPSTIPVGATPATCP